MKKTLSLAAAVFLGAAFAQQGYTTTTQTVVKNVTTTVVEQVTYEQQSAGLKKIAVFVQNRTPRTARLDDEVDGVRDRLAAALAEVDGLSVVDSAQVADTFRRYKVTVDEEKSNLVPGIFSGGSVPRVSQMLGCDYIAAATIVNASSMKRNIGGRLSTVFTLRMTMKVMDATGASVDGMPTWVRQMPVLDAADDHLNYYQMLFDQWAADVTTAIAQKAPRWRAPSAANSGLVEFFVSTTIDQTVAELESQTKGASGEQLQELRKVVGGVSVELDGAVIGSSPGPFRATPGLHQIKVFREWMKPYFATVNVQPGMTLNVALEMSDEGMRKWGTLESMRADIARRYADAVRERGMKINIDTSGWRDVGNSGIRVLKDN